MNQQTLNWVLYIAAGIAIITIIGILVSWFRKSGVNIPSELAKLTHTMNSLEDLLVNLISILVPWGVPLIPAYITYQHVADPEGLNFGKPMAFIAGSVVEALGLATMNTFFKFYKHNRKYTSEANKMPTWVPVSAYFWYLLITILVNVVFDIFSGIQWYYILAVALFSTLSIPAGALISVRAIHTEWQVKQDEDAAKRSSSKDGSKKTETDDEPEPEQVNGFSQFVEDFLGDPARNWKASMIGTHPGALMTAKRLSEEMEVYLERPMTPDEKRALSVKLTRMRKQGK